MKNPQLHQSSDRVPQIVPKSYWTTTQTEIALTDTANITVVRRFYGNLGSPEILTQVLSPTIRWELDAPQQFGRVVHAPACVSGGSRSAWRSVK
jgi:hypothetical protein